MNPIIIGIVCNDNRADILAQKLIKSEPTVEIYRFKSQESFMWKQPPDTLGSWSFFEDTLNTEIHLLFHHTNDALHEHLPPQVDYIKIAKFTTPGEPVVKPGECPIIPPFPYNSCPLNSKNVKEFIEWVRGERDMPSICQAQISLILLPQLFFFCQGYLFIQAQNMEQQKQAYSQEINYALQQLGWFRLEEPIKQIIMTNLNDKQSQSEQKTWWFEDASLDDLEQVCQIINSELKFLNADNSVEVSLNKLLEEINSNEINFTTVAKAYQALSSLLSITNDGSNFQRWKFS